MSAAMFLADRTDAELAQLVDESMSSLRAVSGTADGWVSAYRRSRLVEAEVDRRRAS